jgi:Rad3-related DNA helicase
MTPSAALLKGRSNYVCLQQLHAGPGAREPEQDELWDGATSTVRAAATTSR